VALEELVGLEEWVALEDLEEAGPRQSNGSTTLSTGKELPTATLQHGTSILRQTARLWTTGWTTGGMTEAGQALPIGVQEGNRPRCRTERPVERVPEPGAGTTPSAEWTEGGR
jgi:hypothetical protein